MLKYRKIISAVSVVIDISLNALPTSYVFVSYLVSIDITLSPFLIKQFLSKTEYNALFINESTGNVEIPKDYLFDNVDISLSTGDVNFCASVSRLAKIKAITGNICVENTSAGALELSVTTGKVTVI